MNKLKFVVSFTTKDNDYQQEQAISAEDEARRNGVQLQTLYAFNDAVTQGTQLLQIIYGPAASRPDAIILEPVAGGLIEVARAAANTGIGWVVLNRDVDYIGELRRTCPRPVFAISSDHVEAGRIQGQQLTALLPHGGTVLYIQGPLGCDAAMQRTLGMNQARASNIQVRMLRGRWTEASAYEAVDSWLRITTVRNMNIGAVVAQNDAMALGARKAFQALTSGVDKERWLRLPYLGIDGLSRTGDACVKNGQLAATVAMPPNASLAVSMLVRAIATGIPPAERTITVPKSLPSLESLRARGQKTSDPSAPFKSEARP